MERNDSSNNRNFSSSAVEWMARRTNRLDTNSRYQSNDHLKSISVKDQTPWTINRSFLRKYPSNGRENGYYSRQNSSARLERKDTSPADISISKDMGISSLNASSSFRNLSKEKIITSKPPIVKAYELVPARRHLDTSFNSNISPITFQKDRALGISSPVMKRVPYNLQGYYHDDRRKNGNGGLESIKESSYTIHNQSKSSSDMHHNHNASTVDMLRKVLDRKHSKGNNQSSSEKLRNKFQDKLISEESRGIYSPSQINFESFKRKLSVERIHQNDSDYKYNNTNRTNYDSLRDRTRERDHNGSTFYSDMKMKSYLEPENTGRTYNIGDLSEVNLMMFESNKKGGVLYESEKKNSYMVSDSAISHFAYSPPISQFKVPASYKDVIMQADISSIDRQIELISSRIINLREESKSSKVSEENLLKSRQSDVKRLEIYFQNEVESLENQLELEKQVFDNMMKTHKMSYVRAGKNETTY